MASLITIPARQGKAITLRRGQHIKVINTHGQQVIDTWAFNRADLTECLSMEHSRASLSRIIARVGDSMVTNHRRPILTIVEDTSPGIHDTLIAACDRYRYELLGCTTHHDNCTDNLVAGMAALGLTPPKTPSPWNLFMNIPVQAVGGLSIRQAIECPSRGAPLVVLGAPLVIDADEFKPAAGATLRDVLSEICRQIRRTNQTTR